MRARVPFVALAILLAAAASASAQYRGGTFELNPYAGYLFGGHYGNRDIDFNTRLDVDDHVIYGGRIGYNFTNLWQVELEYAQSDTHLEIDDNFGDDEQVADLRFQYFLGYLTLNFGSGRFVPYFTIGSGGANLRIRAPGGPSDSDLRYTGAIGGGIKLFFNPHFGMRFDGRVYTTYLGDTTVVCGPFVVCRVSNWVSNVVTNGGFIIAF